MTTLCSKAVRRASRRDMLRCHPTWNSAPRDDCARLLDELGKLRTARHQQIFASSPIWLYSQIGSGLNLLLILDAAGGALGASTNIYSSLS
ncbi:hypothetical protein EXIGLDRAFT_723010 [Exidia glandulosa HHB12029]|uniref:Uncharacterized protein n=1 Tax=Exidia glandulosa HHB12029 TaxID=1314781 RepID=A0A165EZP3_EXIGL|nr:hypothetical protein EXIGLDRAFT_723010 [Exidia glandulosa HHB12029]